MTNVVGVVCGAAGLVLTLVWGRRVLELHLWELTAMPFVLAQVYWIIAGRAQAQDTLDEKQTLDMTYAGAVTMAWAIPGLCAAWILCEEGLLDAALWFPCFLFFVLLVFSGTVLFRFRRA